MVPEVLVVGVGFLRQQAVQVVLCLGGVPGRVGDLRELMVQVVGVLGLVVPRVGDAGLVAGVVVPGLGLVASVGSRDQLLRGPGRILRSGSPDLVRQEIWGCLLTAWAVSALISDAAAAAWIDPGRVSFTKAVRIVRRAVGPAFPPSAG